MIRLAKNENFHVKCHDPHVQEFEYGLLDLKSASKETDCIVLVADHDEFKDIDTKTLEVRNKNIIDCRNIIDIDKWKELDYEVKILGSSEFKASFSSL